MRAREAYEKTRESELLERARLGDERAFAGAWRGLSRFEERSSLLTWLYTIATNSCLKMVKQRGRRILATEQAGAAHVGAPPGAPLPESVWLEPYPDEKLAVGSGSTTIHEYGVAA